MARYYRDIITYNPYTNKVTYLRHLGMDERFVNRIYLEAAREILEAQDPATEIAIAVTPDNEIYQLSYSPSKKYIRENLSSMKFINREKVLVAVSQYKTKKRMWVDED